MKRLPHVDYLVAAISDGVKTETRRAGKPNFKVGEIVGVGEIIDSRHGLVRYRRDDAKTNYPWRWKLRTLSGRYTPDELIRVKIKILSIEEELADDMTDDAVIREGITYWGYYTRTHTLRVNFEALWRDINGEWPRKWWVIKFELYG